MAGLNQLNAASSDLPRVDIQIQMAIMDFSSTGYTAPTLEAEYLAKPASDGGLASLGVIGTCSSSMTSVINPLLAAYDVPQISFGDTMARLESSDYYGLVRASKTNLMQGSAVVGLLLHFGWNTCAIYRDARSTDKERSYGVQLAMVNSPHFYHRRRRTAQRTPPEDVASHGP